MWSTCGVGHDAPSADEALFVGAQPLHPLIGPRSSQKVQQLPLHQILGLGLRADLYVRQRLSDAIGHRVPHDRSAAFAIEHHAHRDRLSANLEGPFLLFVLLIQP